MRANRANEPLLWPIDVIHQEIITTGLTISDKALATAGRQLMGLHPKLHRVARADFLESWKGDPIRARRANSRVGRQGWNQARLAQENTHSRCAVMAVAAPVGNGCCDLI